MTLSKLGPVLGPEVSPFRTHRFLHRIQRLFNLGKAPLPTQVAGVGAGTYFFL